MYLVDLVFPKDYSSYIAMAVRCMEFTGTLTRILVLESTFGRLSCPRGTRETYCRERTDEINLGPRGFHWAR